MVLKRTLVKTYFGKDAARSESYTGYSAQVNDVTHHDNALFIFLLGKISDVVKTKLFYDSALISMWDK